MTTVPNIRQRSNTLSVDTSQSTLTSQNQYNTKDIGESNNEPLNGIQNDSLSTISEQEGVSPAAYTASEEPSYNTSTPLQPRYGRSRSRTVVDNPPSWSTLLKDGPLGGSPSLASGRPLSAVMLDPPDSPSVMGMKGRYKLQKDASHAEYGSSFMRSGKWCDDERKNLAAYEYLCHVSEAKEWIETCIGKEIPDIATLEGSLRDGVTLAELAKTFCPEAVGKIYYPQPTKNATTTSSVISNRRLVFKYTDNINFFLRAIRMVNLPRLFHFELTDLYDRKNMPRVIYCLHALSHLLVKVGNTPLMKDHFGRLEFSEDQLAQTQAELDNLGINVPSFHHIRKDIGDRKPRLSSIHSRNEDSDDSSSEDVVDDKSDNTKFEDEDYAFLDDPDIDRTQKAKLYWERRIELFIRLQAQARQRLAEYVLEEKRQARRYQRMWESAIVMQSLVRMILAKRVLNSYKQEIIDAEDKRIKAQLEERARKHREEAEAEQRRLDEEKRVENERLKKERSEKEKREKERAEKEKAKRLMLEKQHAELERRIISIQAYARARLARKVFLEIRQWMASFVGLQAACRGYIVRKEYGNRISEWKRVETAVKTIQALGRGYLIRKRFRERRAHLKRNINVIVKLQNMYRAKLAGKAYRTLTVEDTPPTPKIVQSCAPMLEDTDQDLEEELDLERLRQKAVRQIRDNQHTSRILEQLDIKIALLVRNRISLEEVIRQTRRHFRFLNELRRPSSIASSSFRNSYSSLALAGAVPANSLYSLKNLDKESRRRLDGYQHLFYLLQTQPIYLARLLFLLNQGGSRAMGRANPANSPQSSNGSITNNSYGNHNGNGRRSQEASRTNNVVSRGGEDISISKLLETIVLTLFGFAQNAREEYLLLKLFCAAIKVELDSISSIHEFLRGNPIFIKLAVHYNRGAKERKYLRELLQPLIRKVIEDPDLDLESDPLVIYRSLIREDESRTGEKSRKPYDINPEDALNDMETRTTFIRHLRQLRVLADEFVDAILNSLDSMPYGMRYIARELRRALTEKFPDEAEAQVMKVVGHLVYYRYVNPAIVAPENFDVIETTITPLQRKNLGEIAKMLNQVSVGKHFSEDNMFLQPLNNYVGYTSARFSTYSYEVTDVVDPEVHFQIDEFTDLATLHKPSIYMSISEIQTMHQAIESNLDYIAPPIPKQLKQRFGTYDALISIIDHKRRRETGSTSNQSIGADNEVDEFDDADLVDAIPQGTVLVERSSPDGSSRTLVLEDPLRVVLQDLGAAPRTRSDPYSHYELQLDLTDRFADESITLMSGTASTSVLSASASAILTDAAASASQAALMTGSSMPGGGLLHHHPTTAKEAVHAKAERAANLHRLFLETKRKWLSILQVQSGVSLLEILERPTTAEDESRWRAIIQLELAKLEDRRQKHAIQWQKQWEAQQQLNALRESQEAMLGTSKDGHSTPANTAPQPPPPPPALSGEKVVRELSKLTFVELKRQTARAMRVLETERWVERTRKSHIGTGSNISTPTNNNDRSKKSKHSLMAYRVRKADGYQGMLNAIARDIRTKEQRRSRRRAEMRRIRLTLLNLKEKSDYLESQHKVYEEYLDSCTKQLTASKDGSGSNGGLNGSSSSGPNSKVIRRMHSVLPFTRQYFHLRDLQRSGRMPRFGSYKYSAEKLYHKGVLLKVEGYPPRQLDKISLTISSDESGVFDVQVSLLGVKMQPGGACEIRLEDLLQLQFENVTVMTLFEGAVKVNVNLLVYLINKKFFR